MIDEGVVKYHLEWHPGPSPGSDEIAPLIKWRDRMHEAGLIGHDPEHDVGYGNISLRVRDGFLISGTQTGHIAETTPEHYSRVTGFNIEANSISCTGPAPASSEALTHAGLYQLSPDIGAIVHVHSAELWKQWRDRLPTTAPDVAYGTPAMAREFQRLYKKTEFGKVGIAVMGGHDDGLVAIGQTPEEASKRILSLTGD